MYAQKTTAWFRCTMCHACTPIHVALREFDAAQYTCDQCGAEVWVSLDELRDSHGDRMISHRPFDELTPDGD